MQFFFATPPKPSRHQQYGLTLVEVMVTVAVLGILTGIAAPSFTSMIERWRATQTISALESTWHYARVESLRRGGGVTLTAATCTGASEADWGCGAEVGLTVMENGESATQLLRAVTFNPSIQVSSNTLKVTFDRHGNVSGNSLKFTLKNKSNTVLKEICMSRSFHATSTTNAC